MKSNENGAATAPSLEAFLTTVLIIPYYSDRVGRKWIAIISYLVFIFVVGGILLATDIIWLYILGQDTGCAFLLFRMDFLYIFSNY